MALYATWTDPKNQQGTNFSVGDTIQIHQRLVEGDGKETKERIQIFEGMVIAINGVQENKSITVRKIATNQIGVERIWPLVSPWISKISIKSSGKVRRAKLFYTRNQSRKDLRKITQKT